MNRIRHLKLKRRRSNQRNQRLDCSGAGDYQRIGWEDLNVGKKRMREIEDEEMRSCEDLNVEAIDISGPDLLFSWYVFCSQQNTKCSAPKLLPPQAKGENPLTACPERT